MTILEKAVFEDVNVTVTLGASGKTLFVVDDELIRLDHCMSNIISLQSVSSGVFPGSEWENLIYTPLPTEAEMNLIKANCSNGDHAVFERLYQMIGPHICGCVSGQYNYLRQMLGLSLRQLKLTDLTHCLLDDLFADDVLRQYFIQISPSPRPGRTGLAEFREFKHQFSCDAAARSVYAAIVRLYKKELGNLCLDMDDLLDGVPRLALCGWVVEEMFQSIYCCHGCEMQVRQTWWQRDYHIWMKHETDLAVTVKFFGKNPLVKDGFPEHIPNSSGERFYVCERGQELFNFARVKVDSVDLILMAVEHKYDISPSALNKLSKGFKKVSLYIIRAVMWEYYGESLAKDRLLYTFKKEEQDNFFKRVCFGVNLLTYIKASKRSSPIVRQPFIRLSELEKAVFEPPTLKRRK
jgi:hypothetical protein